MVTRGGKQRRPSACVKWRSRCSRLNEPLKVPNILARWGQEFAQTVATHLGREGPMKGDAAPARDGNAVAFTPANIRPDRCRARTWNAGQGDQCGNVPVAGTRYCNRHAATRAHGDVEGETPPPKLREFLKKREQAQ